MGKKKGAANKLAKMSEEERARYLQHRADMEEEARRRKQQLIAVFLKNKLKREEAFSRLNMAKINQEWRSILRNIKCVELRNEAKNVQTYFNDAFQRKNQTIKRLLNELDQQEEMYSTMLNAHMGTINKLIGLHSDRLVYWTNQYEEEKQILLNQYASEMERYKDRKFRAQKELECVYYAMESANEAQIKQNEQEQMAKTDEIKSQMMLNLREMTEDRETKMNELWSEFQQLLRNYSEQTEEKYMEYIEMRDRDNADTKEIHQHYSEIAKAIRDISLLKGILEAQSNQHRIHMDQLKQYHDLLKEKQKRLKKNMDSTDKLHKKILKTIVISSTEANEKLDKILAKGKNILQLTAMCSKYETEREEISHFTIQNTLENAQEVKEETKDVADTKDGQDTNEKLKDFKELNLHVISKTEHFWTRYKNVEIDCSCLEEERRGLQKENHQLKEKLKQYLQDIAITNGRIGSTKERLRPQSMKIERPTIASAPPTRTKQKPRPVTGVEGNLSVAVRSKHLVEAKLKIPSIYSVGK